MVSNYPNETTDDAQPDRDDGTAVRPKQPRHNYPEDEIEHYCRVEGTYSCPCRHIADLKKRIDDLEVMVERLREYLSAVVQAEDPDFADLFE